MRYQLVLQFRATDLRDFDELVALEERLIEWSLPDSYVDGHDVGLEEFNIFLLASHPKETFEAAKLLIEGHQPGKQFKAAYREVSGEKYVILWPPDLRVFEVA